MWTWTFVYDVIHGLSIPAFRIKQDVVPGKNNAMWFIAGQEGEYEILCTAYCGLRHSYMESKVKVVSEEEFNRWVKAIPSTASEPEGLAIIKKNACTGCHSLDGSKLVSASFKGLFGKTETVITDGKEHQVVVDEAYIKTSIYEPDKDLVKGLPKGVMKSYKSLINEEELNKVIDYLKTIK